MARLSELVMVLQRRLPVGLVRLGYRIAYRVAQVMWFVVRPGTHGVKGVLRDGDRVLLVRHTYGNRKRWDVPGGHAHRNESPVDAVGREMREEIGIALTWEHVGSLGAHTDHKVERIHCFVADRPADAPLDIAWGEIADARWFALDALPAPIGELSVRALGLLDGRRST